MMRNVFIISIASGEMNYDGIEKKNVLKWMLGEAPA
jgi:hypothetical protein